MKRMTLYISTIFIVCIVFCVFNVFTLQHTEKAILNEKVITLKTAIDIVANGANRAETLDDSIEFAREDIVEIDLLYMTYAELFKDENNKLISVSERTATDTGIKFNPLDYPEFIKDAPKHIKSNKAQHIDLWWEIPNESEDRLMRCVYRWSNQDTNTPLLSIAGVSKQAVETEVPASLYFSFFVQHVIIMLILIAFLSGHDFHHEGLERRFFDE